MRRALVLLCATAVGGCSQAAQLHFARGSERLHTPSAKRASADERQHVTVAAALPPVNCDGAKVKSYNHHVCCAHVTELVAPENLAELEKTIAGARHVR